MIKVCFCQPVSLHQEYQISPPQWQGSLHQEKLISPAGEIGCNVEGIFLFLQHWSIPVTPWPLPESYSYGKTWSLDTTWSTCIIKTDIRHSVQFRTNCHNSDIFCILYLTRRNWKSDAMKHYQGRSQRSRNF